MKTKNEILDECLISGGKFMQVKNVESMIYKAMEVYTSQFILENVIEKIEGLKLMARNPWDNVYNKAIEHTLAILKQPESINNADRECKDKPKIICTIGSSRFCDVEAVAKWQFEKEGNICIGMHLLPDWYIKDQKWTENHHGGEQEDVAEIMDALHLKKIKMADKVFVINVNGYIGERTRFEIEYAQKLNKPIDYFEPITELPKPYKEDYPSRKDKFNSYYDEQGE